MLPAARGMVFVGDLDAIDVDEGDRHHLARVLRLRAGEAVLASDGRGAWRMCVVDGDRERLRLEPTGGIQHEAAPEPIVTIAFAVPKGERAEWAVQKLTELGVDRIVPMVTERSVVRWDHERGHRHSARLREVARQAAMQSRRPWLPDVAALTPFADVVAEAGGSGALCQAGGGPPDLHRPRLLVGPEGGWSDGELAVSLPRVGLGPTVLRAETAAIAAGVLLTALRSGTVRPTRI